MKIINDSEKDLHELLMGNRPNRSESLDSKSFELKITSEERDELIASIVSKSSAPRINIQANEFRGGPDATSKEVFRRTLLARLRSHWTIATEAQFIRLINILERDGCAVFAGLIDVEPFAKLIDDFSQIMTDSGSQAFLHYFANLVDHPDLLRAPEYNDAIIHPLLVALISYAMGGPVRMTDARGKDTQPISVNAQDNMLHVDNTPFREEYKILLGWEKDKVKGPTGQNFTFLPGTHKGNRFVRENDQSQPWSTENDSLFITEESIQNVFQFQKDITGCKPTVVEVEYPEQPITVLFSAGSLVHHRYRNNGGSTRSCVIAAFHLAYDHPGALLDVEDGAKPESIADVLLQYQDGTNIDAFCSMIASRADDIESKILELLDDEHHSILVDVASLTLSGERFARWQEITINAPQATQLKFEAGNYISHTGTCIGRSVLVKRLAAAMAYDKHGLLDLIIYKDGHEEIRKPARKSVWTMSRETLEQVLVPWLPVIEAHIFTIADVQKPTVLVHYADRAADLIRLSFPTIKFGIECSRRDEQRLSSAHQLIADLGESITRCEKVETYITTNLFLFLIIDQILTVLHPDMQQEMTETCVMFLKTYVACVLMVEAGQNY
ncbi:hypothetical protein K431DRAFT_308166 [Polychaeton citri CBS 116435]|uniref:Uncharacterized protein n=1 Tax=Polychaeton citri CBS 116435 TaxID=1314669 RepID=A0A9P4PY59_9PEZI|nr:hypothetical protein K431DRAFT_308166 [Polychaeton citri CBS 116435]